MIPRTSVKRDCGTGVVSPGNHMCAAAPYLQRWVTNMLMQRSLMLLFALGAVSVSAFAVEYSCEVSRKFDSEREYPREQISKLQFSNRVEESKDGAYISRCSFAPSAGKVTCDRYKMDQVAFDENVKIKKYYSFKSQFDFQMFPDLSFVENNGRGGISYGKCTVTAP